MFNSVRKCEWLFAKLFSFKLFYSSHLFVLALNILIGNEE